MMKEAKEIHFSSPIMSDLFFCKKYLPTHLNLKIEFLKSADKFYFMGQSAAIKDKLRLRFTKLEIMARTVHVIPEFLDSQASMFLKQPAKIPLISSSCRFQSIPSGITDFEINTIYSGLSPSLILVGILDNNSVYGSYELNPYSIGKTMTIITFLTYLTLNSFQNTIM